MHTKDSHIIVLVWNFRLPDGEVLHVKPSFPLVAADKVKTASRLFKRHGIDLIPAVLPAAVCA